MKFANNISQYLPSSNKFYGIYYLCLQKCWLESRVMVSLCSNISYFLCQYPWFQKKKKSSKLIIFLKLLEIKIWKFTLLKDAQLTILKSQILQNYEANCKISFNTIVVNIYALTLNYYLFLSSYLCLLGRKAGKNSKMMTSFNWYN